MTFKIMSTTAAVAAAFAATAIAAGPVASAEPADDCTTAQTATVCEPSINVTPPGAGDAGGAPHGANDQNGSYGPAGEAPPVGN